MRSFDKANCRQGVVSELSPHLVSGRGWGGRAGPGISGNNSIRCAHDRTQSRGQYPVLSPSSSPPPSLFVFSVAREPGEVRGLLSGVAKVKQSGYSQPPHIALLWEQNSTFQLLSWTILIHDDILNVRCSQRESLARLWPHGCHARAPDPGTDMARTPLTLLAWAGQCFTDFTLLTDTWCQWCPAWPSETRGVFLPPF